MPRAGEFPDRMVGAEGEDSEAARALPGDRWQRGRRRGEAAATRDPSAARQRALPQRSVSPADEDGREGGGAAQAGHRRRAEHPATQRDPPAPAATGLDQLPVPHRLVSPASEYPRVGGLPGAALDGDRRGPAGEHATQVLGPAPLRRRRAEYRDQPVVDLLIEDAD